MLKRTLSFIAKFLAIILTILTLGIIIISFIKPDWIETGIIWIGELIETLGYWNYLIAFSSACLESLPFIGTAIPGMNIMILVGGFWAKDHFAFTIIAAIIGAMLGNYIGYWIGKYFGKEFIERYGDWFGLGKTEEKILVKQIEKNGFWYIVLGKFHNFTRSFVPFIAGSAGMLERNFWLYNMIGSIIWAASINMLGIFFIDNYKMILDRLGTVMLVFFVGIMLYFYFFKKELLVTYIRDKQSEIDAKVKK
ncbi:MAG: DedA family protein [Candidatus Gracilibacteria bacterium]|nr:DedA family protein [Candidatus Gracilibacteria bacterium]